jgi:hypothetical protein
MPPTTRLPPGCFASERLSSVTLTPRPPQLPLSEGSLADTARPVEHGLARPHDPCDRITIESSNGAPVAPAGRCRRCSPTTRRRWSCSSRCVSEAGQLLARSRVKYTPQRAPVTRGARYPG